MRWMVSIMALAGVVGVLGVSSRLPRTSAAQLAASAQNKSTNNRTLLKDTAFTNRTNVRGFKSR